MKRLTLLLVFIPIFSWGQTSTHKTQLLKIITALDTYYTFVIERLLIAESTQEFEQCKNNDLESCKALALYVDGLAADVLEQEFGLKMLMQSKDIQESDNKLEAFVAKSLPLILAATESELTQKMEGLGQLCKKDHPFDCIFSVRTALIFYSGTLLQVFHILRQGLLENQTLEYVLDELNRL